MQSNRFEIDLKWNLEVCTKKLVLKFFNFSFHNKQKQAKTLSIFGQKFLVPTVLVPRNFHGPLKWNFSEAGTLVPFFTFKFLPDIPSKYTVLYISLLKFTHLKEPCIISR